jgi:hypothetical protein
MKVRVNEVASKLTEEYVSFYRIPPFQDKLKDMWLVYTSGRVQSINLLKKV